MHFQQLSGKTGRGGKPFGCQCGCSRRAATLNVYLFIENRWDSFTHLCVYDLQHKKETVILADATWILVSEFPTNMCDDWVKTWLEWPNTVAWRAAVSCMLSLSPSSLRQGNFSRTTAAEGRERQGRWRTPKPKQGVFSPQASGFSNESTPSWTHSTSSPKPFERSGKKTHSPGFPTVFRRAGLGQGGCTPAWVSAPPHRSLGNLTRTSGSSRASSGCDPETAVHDWLRSGCPSGMSASPSVPCHRAHFRGDPRRGSSKKKEQLSHQWRADKHRHSKSFFAEV